VAQQKKKKPGEGIGLSPQEYQKIAKQAEPKRNVLMNGVRAYLVGGLICVIGQLVQTGFIEWFGFEKKEAGNPTVAVMILLSTILTGLGVYDKIAQWAGAGTSVPVTGFANSMASSAIEHRSEGFVLGVGGKMFKIAGPVIVCGTVAAFFVAIVYMIFHPELAGGGK
jgi:stage V sporulation protein AC